MTPSFIITQSIVFPSLPKLIISEVYMLLMGGINNKMRRRIIKGKSVDEVKLSDD
ncbi:hypothetical protein JCM19275_1272 [Nonlabens ulvanivorans]|uniref:Uncharacterized protein n=1 Tax=Nonlabens ulvanivorans TaxID=906888 RepID=A0A090WK20_NONUL|nr:hypothetical protein JCM19275_1272 [Nonlabens ulvanivorans]